MFALLVPHFIDIIIWHLIISLVFFLLSALWKGMSICLLIASFITLNNMESYKMKKIAKMAVGLTAVAMAASAFAGGPEMAAPSISGFNIGLGFGFKNSD